MNNLTLKRYILKTLKIDNYIKDYRIADFPPYLKSVLIGLLLSDGGLERSYITSFVRLSVIMSMKNYPYVLHLYNLFEPYINSDIITIDIKNKSNLNEQKIYTTVRFKTISLPHLVKYYNIFYKENKSTKNRIKVVPNQLKYNFDSIALAHLIMGDGNYIKEMDVIRLYTNSFDKSNVNLLSKIIKKNLGIDNKVIHDRNNQYIIKIEKSSINLTRNLVLQYMHPCMYYKLGLELDLNKGFDYSKIIDLI